MFFEFNQNNSGGYFRTTDTLCHRLFIEADNEDDAIRKAENLGCYWDGVSQGIDCPCCGDRWYKDYLVPIDLQKYRTEGYRVSIYEGIYRSAKSEWEKRYGHLKVLKEPSYHEGEYFGMVRFDGIEDYAQFLADDFGWTKPDARIFYKNGLVKEVFSRERLMST